MLEKDWIYSALAVAAVDVGEHGYGHWSEYQYTVQTLKI